MKTCTVDGCAKKLLARGWCAMHYYRMAKHGSLELPPPPPRPDRTIHACSVDGCERSQWSKGLCGFHYTRLNRTGEIGSVEPLTAPAGSGCVRPDGYRVLRLHDHPLASKDGQVLEHRVVLYAVIGPGEHRCHWCGVNVAWERSYPFDLRGLVVDHLDRNRSNNTARNLVPSCGPCNSRIRPGVAA